MLFLYNIRIDKDSFISPNIITFKQKFSRYELWSKLS